MAYTNFIDHLENAPFLKEKKHEEFDVVGDAMSRCDYRAEDKNSNISFHEGQIVLGNVKCIAGGCAYFNVQGANSVVVSLNSLSGGGISKVSLLHHKKRDVFRLRVKSWYPKTKQLVLSGVIGRVAAGFPVKKNSNVMKDKTDYTPLAKGTAILVDGANLLSAFKPSEAADVLISLSSGLKDAGYGIKIFLEHRSWKYLVCNQESEEAGKRFKSVCRDFDVTIVGRESDLAILQGLGAVAGTVGLTNDRYSDYAKVFPDLVGTSRLRGFSVTEISGEKLLMIDGLAKAVKIDRCDERKDEYFDSYTHRNVVGIATVDDDKDESIDKMTERAYTKDVLGGLCGYGHVLLVKGKVQGAMHCFEKVVAKHNAEGFNGLAEICSWCGDVKKAAKFTKLGEKLARRHRDQKIRNLRIVAERRRIGNHCQVRLSA